jgi:hypothetical protein
MSVNRLDGLRKRASLLAKSFSPRRVLFSVG